MTVLDRDAVSLVEALGVLPETFWSNEDDSCDCTYQRIGMWKNVYIGETLEVRLCCIWAELYKLFPQHVRVTPAYLVNDEAWDERIREWDGESDMPRAIFYRQMARKDGITVEEARKRYARQEPPKGTPRPVLEEEPVIDPISALLEVVYRLQQRVDQLEAK